MYFDKPLFELPSLADRFSDILGLDVLSYVCDRGFWEASPLALGKKAEYQCLGDVESSTDKNIFLSRFYFCSLLKTNIHQKGRIKKKSFERN